jgi:hypothetical protein
MKTPDDFTKLIQIEQQKLALTTTPEQKHVIQIRIQKLQLEKEIAIIRKRIQQLS